MLEVCLGQPDIACMPHSTAPNTLRHGALDTGPLGVVLFEFWSRDPLTPSSQRFVLFLRADGDRAPLAVGAGRAMFASLTVAHRELDLDHCIGAIVERRCPTIAHPSCRTLCLLRLPINREIRSRKALSCLCLTTIIAPYRP